MTASSSTSQFSISPLSLAPLSIGLIGPRGFGAFCTGAYHDAGVARVRAFAGRDQAAMTAAAKLYGVPQTYSNWREMLHDPDIEAVHIVTPPDKHAEMAIAALRAGKHVFVEKPLATTNEDAQAILSAAREAGKLAGINFVMRYDPLYQTMLTIARSGWLGPLTHIGFENYASDEGLGDDHWFWDSAASGGIFVEHGVHFFDMIGAIVGAPARDVLGRTWRRADGTNKEDRVQALVTYANGIEASFYHAFNRPGALEKQTAHFAFERGHVTLHGWIPTSLNLTAIVDEAGFAGLQTVLPLETICDGDFPAPGRTVRGHGKSYEVTRRVQAHQSLGGPTPVYLKAVQDAMADFAAAVRDPSHQPLVTAEDGAASVRVAAAARGSAEIGAKVLLED
jgi:predicted dehydrogenase